MFLSRFSIFLKNRTQGNWTSEEEKGSLVLLLLLTYFNSSALLVFFSRQPKFSAETWRSKLMRINRFQETFIATSWHNWAAKTAGYFTFLLRLGRCRVGLWEWQSLHAGVWRMKRKFLLRWLLWLLHMSIDL